MYRREDMEAWRSGGALRADAEVWRQGAPEAFRRVAGVATWRHRTLEARYRCADVEV